MATSKTKKPFGRRTTHLEGALKRQFEQVSRMALKLPGVEISTSYGTPALKARGKLMGRLRTEAEGALALRCDFVDREILLQADPEVFFLVAHYLNYPMILVRLDKVRPDVMPDLLERAWKMATGKSIPAADQPGS